MKLINLVQNIKSEINFANTAFSVSMWDKIGIVSKAD